MCGLVFVRSLDGKRAAGRTWKRYLEQKTRGTEGFGFVAFDKTSFAYDRFMTEEALQKVIFKQEGTEMMFHHRFPTSTENLPEAAHPILVRHAKFKNNYYVIHNGMIKNADELKVNHELMGFKYRTEIEKRTMWKAKGNKYYGEAELEFNDSEAFAIDLALVLAGRQDDIEAKGSIAFICLETDKNDKPLFLHYGRGTNPLYLEERKELIALKSAFGGTAVKADYIHTYSYADGTTTDRKADLGYWSTPITPHYGYGKDIDDDGFTPLKNRLGFQLEAPKDDKEDEEDEPQVSVTGGLTPEEHKQLDMLLLEDLETELDSMEDDMTAMQEQLDFYRQHEMHAEASALVAEMVELQKKYDNVQTDIDVWHGIPNI